MLTLPDARPAGSRAERETRAWRPCPAAAAAMARRGQASGASPAAALAAAARALFLRCGHPARVRVEGTPAGGAPHPGLSAAALLRAGPGTEEDADPARPVAAFGSGHDEGADLSFAVGGDGVEARHDPAVYSGETVDALCARLEVVLEAMAADPEQPLRTLPLLTDADRRRLLHEWNGRAAPPPPELLLHRLIEARAALSPDAPALELEGRTLSFRALDARAERVAAWLRRRGIGPEVPVALYSERSLELFAAILGAWKAGGALLYLDPGDPPARTLQLLRAAGAPLLLASASALERAPAEVPVHPLEEAEEDPGPSLGPAPADGENTAYLLFTSGSTGAPKGVRRSHRMCATRMAWEQGVYGMGPEERHLLKSPISFREFVLPLSAGATAVVAPPGAERDDRRLVRLLADARVSVVSFVPSVLRVLVDTPGIRECTALRHVSVGGETLLPDLEARLRAELGVEVHNTYTTTEADYLCHRRGPSEAAGRGSSVGRPTDARVYLCDGEMRLVPPGVAGEICAGGAALSGGYLGRPGLTAERFVPDPFSGIPGALLFRTGDLARHLSNGELEYLGRRDFQVKVRGLRVEPGEVEAHLRAHPAVRDAAVVGVPDAREGSRLAAYVVGTDAPPAADELRAFLRGRVPEFMVPAVFVPLERLPLLPGSGKLDRAALPPPPRRRDTDRAFVPPAPGAEREMAGVWEEELGVAPVGANDDFYALGGTSLLLMRVRARLERLRGGPVSAALLMEHPTVTAACAALAREAAGAAAAATAAAEDGRLARARAERERRARAAGRPA